MADIKQVADAADMIVYNRYNINGLIIVDKNAVGRKISGIPVVAELENAASYICQQWVDEVFVNIDESYSYPDELIQELLEMGMVVHVNLAKVKSTSGQKQFVETVGGYTVLTTTMNYATDRHLPKEHWIFWEDL
jgi:hypothetical protein